MPEFRKTLGASTVLIGLLASSTAGSAATNGSSYKFTVNVTLSPEAADELAQLNEKIIVVADWYGEPTPAGKKQAEPPANNINLGRDEVTISGTGGLAEVNGNGVEVKKIDWVQGRTVRVALGVVSARLSKPNNLLFCNAPALTLKAAQTKPVAVNCNLIRQPPPRT